MSCRNCDCDAKQPCASEMPTMKFKVVATLKKEYWNEEVKRYVIPSLYFIDRENKKPFVTGMKNVEFMLDDLWRVSDVFIFDAFELVTVSTL